MKILRRYSSCLMNVNGARANLFWIKNKNQFHFLLDINFIYWYRTRRAVLIFAFFDHYLCIIHYFLLNSNIWAEFNDFPKILSNSIQRRCFRRYWDARRPHIKASIRKQHSWSHRRRLRCSHPDLDYFCNSWAWRKWKSDSPNKFSTTAASSNASRWNFISAHLVTE